MRILSLWLIFILFCSMNLFAINPFTVDTHQRDFQALQKNKGKKYLPVENIQPPKNARELKSAILTFQNLDGTIEKRELLIDKTIDWHYPIRITQNEASRNIAKRYFSLNDFEFFMEGNNIMISSPNHNIIRHFFLPSPSTIVLDFSRDNGGVYNAKIGTNEKFFTNISVDSKSNLYRISITLDGIYKYTLKSTKGHLYTITLQ